MYKRQAQGLTDKIALLDTRPRLYSDLYTLGDTDGYFYGALAPSTGFVDLFGIEPYYNGFYLTLPLRTAPDRLNTNVEQEKMFGIFQEYQSWVRIMGVPTVGAVNSKVLAGDAGGMIKLAEAFHERKFAWVADTIYDANISRGVRMVLISGPSSSGKTTSAKRLGIQLGVLGLQPVLISLDDYFVDREKTPRDADGDYDYEALEAIDLDLFNDHLCRLMRGEKGRSGLLHHFLTPAAGCLLVCVLIWGVLLLMNSSLSSLTDEVNDWLRDPAVVEQYSEAADRQQYNDSLEQTLGQVQALTGYDADTGALRFDAQSTSVIDIPGYVLKLQSLGLFRKVDYTGYTYEDGMYVLSLNCILQGKETAE